jgi:hypothetical protein
LKKKLKTLINFVDDPIDNLKHFLYGNHSISKNWELKVKVPMMGKKYYGFEIAIRRKDEKKKQI